MVYAAARLDSSSQIIYYVAARATGSKARPQIRGHRLVGCISVPLFSPSRMWIAKIIVAIPPFRLMVIYYRACDGVGPGESTSSLVRDSDMAKDERFRPHQRLHLQADFARVIAERCMAGNDVMVVHVARNDLAWSRLGIRVGKRIGNAVRRSYVRRRIREAFRRSRAELASGFDIICVARPKALDRQTDVARTLRALLDKAVRRYGARTG